MKMSHKLTALLFTGIFFASTAKSESLLTTASEQISKAHKAVKEIPFVKNHIAVSLNASDVTHLPAFLNFARPTDPSQNSQLLQAAVISAMISTAFISEKNSLTEIASSGSFSSLGASIAIRHLNNKTIVTKTESSTSTTTIDPKPLFALAFYLLGQNGNQVAGFVNNARKSGLKPAWDLLFARRTKSEIIALLVRNFMPILLTYTENGRLINSAANIFETTPEVVAA